MRKWLAAIVAIPIFALTLALIFPAQTEIEPVSLALQTEDSETCNERLLLDCLEDERVVAASASSAVVVPFMDPTPVATTTTTTTTAPPPTTTTTTTPPTTQAPPPPPPTTQPPAPKNNGGNCGGWYDLIASHFPASEVGTACRVMMCESKGNPNALNGNPKYQAAGLFQIIKQWASRYEQVTGVPYYDGRFDPSANVRFAAWLQGAEGWAGQWVCY